MKKGITILLFVFAIIVCRSQDTIYFTNKEPTIAKVVEINAVIYITSFLKKIAW